MRADGGAPVKRAAAAALLVCGWACQASAPPADPALLELDGQSVRLSEFQRHLSDVQSRSETPLEPAVRRSLLDAFLEQRVLVLEARRRGLVPTGASPEAEQAGAGALVADVARSVPPPDEADVERYLADHREEFGVPETVALRQILVSTLNEARDVLRRLRKDPRSFERLARSMSKGPEAAEGGRMGSFARGQLPEALEKLAFSLATGATGGPVETPLGYHVVKVDARTPARECPLDDCRMEARARLENERADRAVHDFVTGLMARAEVNHDAAQSTVGDRP